VVDCGLRDRGTPSLFDDGAYIATWPDDDPAANSDPASGRATRWATLQLWLCGVPSQGAKADETRGWRGRPSVSILDTTRLGGVGELSLSFGVAGYRGRGWVGEGDEADLSFPRSVSTR